VTKTKTKPPKKKTEPLKQPASKEYRLLSVDTEKMPVELSQEERDRCAIELAELVEQKEALTEEKRDVVREWRVKLNAKQEEVDDCAAGVIRGAKPKAFSIETRAIYKTRMIERVRAEDGKLIDRRVMTPDEEVTYLQTDIGGDRATSTLNRDPSPDAKTGPLKLVSGDSSPEASSTLVHSTGPDEPTEEQEVPEIDDDTRAALGGLPRGWRKVWLDSRWLIEGEALPLSGGDLFEVYLRISGKGSTTAILHAACEPVGLSLGHVQRALAIMRRCGLVRADEGGVWFVTEEAPEVETEPGRTDTLPEAAEVKRPKRGGSKTKADALVNTGLEQTEGYTH